MLIFSLSLCLILCGCGPSPKELADQQSRKELKQAVAAVKTCTHGATYSEFRAKRLELETCYTVNQSALTNQAVAIYNLLDVARVTDTIWDPSVNNSAATKAMRTIEHLSGVSAKEFDSEYKDFPNNYVRRGLTLVSDQCDELLINN